MHQHFQLFRTLEIVLIIFYFELGSKPLSDFFELPSGDSLIVVDSIEVLEPSRELEVLIKEEPIAV